MSNNNRKITIARGVGYGLVDLMGGGAFTIIGAFLLFFYTTFAGLTPIEGASIIAIARIVDAVASLFIGSISDNFYKTKLGKLFGRRRFFLLIGAPLMADYVLLWVTGRSYAFYLVTYLLFEIIAAMVLIPWETLPAEMTKDFTDRTKLSASRMFISATGTFLATFVPGRLIAFFGDKSPQAYFINGLVFAIIYAICILISHKVTWERDLTPEMEQELLNGSTSKSFGEQLMTIVKVAGDYVSTFKIRAFRQHLAIYICSFTAKDLFNSVFIYFCVFNLGVSSTTAANVLSLSIIGIPVTILGGFLMIKVGPGNLYKMAYSIMIVCLLAFYGLYVGNLGSNIVLLFVIGTIYQVGRSLLEFTPWNVFPFIPDVDEMVTRQRREGLFAAVMTFTRKSSVAIATFVIGVVLQESGFVKGQATQSPQVVSTIATLLAVGCISLLVIALICAATFKLNKRTHGILVDEVERLKNNGSKEEVTPETKTIVENLTGYKYENVWKETVV
ncbi:MULTISPECIES: MFS transporter [Clostridium]|jgi:Na+/melibiose symporter and related transporters|uniref:MFS transporter n=2 Tax=Clostridium beijerinckii TaxID=1520 RepID=A0A1S8R945_CLOBE|nr:MULTISPECIES: MFS transporter [Clostridium]ABR36191.1 oligogalacturonide transporter [Clostridium beijerinckii NCIMB 8052]AIU01315.1 oligogalacturonide transporter [Clostridium beijerinckii ATCC 35702]ALB44760.1 MFS transporter [Clostridium beijerinckii NRRL B-598]AVK48074.1 MFS transporter [Clostridium sp. MF28]MBC2458299.1 MFS transporter [Clostridium beijerinckii]